MQKIINVLPAQLSGSLSFIPNVGEIFTSLQVFQDYMDFALTIEI